MRSAPSLGEGIAFAMSDQQIPDDDDLLDLDFVCRFFGGTRSPLHPSTIYRGIDDGRISRPFKTTRNTNCWTGRQLKADMQRMINAPREPLPSPNPRARKRANQSEI